MQKSFFFYAFCIVSLKNLSLAETIKVSLSSLSLSFSLYQAEFGITFSYLAKKSKLTKSVKKRQFWKKKLSLTETIKVSLSLLFLSASAYIKLNSASHFQFGKKCQNTPILKKRLFLTGTIKVPISLLFLSASANSKISYLTCHTSSNTSCCGNYYFLE